MQSLKFSEFERFSFFTTWLSWNVDGAKKKTLYWKRYESLCQIRSDRQEGQEVNCIFGSCKSKNNISVRDWYAPVLKVPLLNTYSGPVQIL